MRSGCETGCKVFAGGEIKHHKDCQYYPESMSKMYDDLQMEVEKLRLQNINQQRELLRAFLDHIDCYSDTQINTGYNHLIDGFFETHS